MPLARGEALGCFCLTEPHVGSDAGAIATRAERDGDHYVLNGVKQFITTGKNADVAVVFAVTDKAAGKKGISAFLSSTRRRRATSSRGSRRSSASARPTPRRSCSRTAACRRPTCSGARARATGSRSRTSRAGASASRRRRSAWRARRSRRRSPTRASGRASASRSSSTRRSTSSSPTWRPQIEVARQLVWHAAALRDAGQPCLKEASMAKLFASEMAERVCSDAIQIHGGYGYVARLSGRAHLPRRARLPDLRGHERDPAARDRPRARRLKRMTRGGPRWRAPIDFYFDFSSPYGYLAAQKIEALAAKHGRTVDWHPMLLGVVFKQTGAAPLTRCRSRASTRSATSRAARASTASRDSACRRSFRSRRRRRRGSCCG